MRYFSYFLPLRIYDNYLSIVFKVRKDSARSSDSDSGIIPVITCHSLKNFYVFHFSWIFWADVQTQHITCDKDVQRLSALSREVDINGDQEHEWDQRDVCVGVSHQSSKHLVCSVFCAFHFLHICQQHQSLHKWEAYTNTVVCDKSLWI
jgi:hypothetical protein